MVEMNILLEFELVFGVSVVAMLVLMILFYVIYPYDKEI